MPVIHQTVKHGAHRGSIAQQLPQSSRRLDVSMGLVRSQRRIMISSSSSAYESLMRLSRRIEMPRWLEMPLRAWTIYLGLALLARMFGAVREFSNANGVRCETAALLDDSYAVQM